MKKYVLLIINLAVLSNILLAQIVPPKKALTINVDYSRFSFSPDTTYVEVSYLLYPSGVTMEKNKDTLKGSIILHTMVKDSKGDSLVARSSVSVPVIIADTSSLNLGIIWKSGFLLPIGIYELSILGYDHRDASNRDSVLKKFTIEKKGQGIWISDIDICSRIVQSDDKKNLFYKNSYEVTPNPSLLFGKSIVPVLFSYVELYNLNPDSIYLVVAGIADGKGQLIKDRRQTRRFTNPNVIDVQTLNVTNIPSGRYRYILVLADTSGKEIAHSEKQIYVHNPHITSSASTKYSAKSAEFAGLSDDELKDEFRKAKYLANKESIEMFEDKISTLDGRREFLAKFWMNVESGQFGRNDMTRAIYLERVSIANQRFHVMGKEGWNTDRGRVQILYGEPDEVQRFPSLESSKPYETWNYFQIEGGVQFVFVDRTGFGEYILVHSTKRGELQDEGWERNLR